MTESEKLKRDIRGLNEAIRLDWVELESKNLSTAERADIRRHINWLIEELAALITRLDGLDRNATV
jgi:hypothetical protein